MKKGFIDCAYLNNNRTAENNSIYKYETVKGYIEKDIGYYKHYNQFYINCFEWRAIDIKTGLLITKAKTLKGCIDNTQKLIEKIKQQRETDNYKKYITEYEKQHNNN